jgi:pimeloyl-ACP methyl ester carboxylesterase
VRPLRVRASLRTPPVAMSSDHPPVVVLPGFGNADKDYKTPFSQPEEKGLCAALQRRGFDDVTVVDLPRWEWIRVAGGLFDPLFWLGKQRPDGLAYGWYLRRARDTIDAAYRRSDRRVLVLGHSAGGWLARATLGDGEWISGERTASVVCGLVTLGAPHFPPPAGSPPCATRGALAYCDEMLPGAHLASEGISYVTVAGAAIEGSQARVGEGEGAGYDPTVPAREMLANGAAPTEADELYSRRGEGSAARVAFTNYQALAGDGGAVGDGVIPVSCAHLEGAEQITLDGVLHSINEAGTTLPTERWYGSEGVVDRWLTQALDGLSP